MEPVRVQKEDKVLTLCFNLVSHSDPPHFCHVLKHQDSNNQSPQLRVSIFNIQSMLTNKPLKVVWMYFNQRS